MSNSDNQALRAGEKHNQPGSEKSAEVKRGPLAPGAVLKGRFLLTQLLAAGGTSDIFQAKDLLTAHFAEESSTLAIKIPRASTVEKASLRYAMTLHETICARRLRHDNIIAIHDCDRDADTYFITMEHVPGEPLSERLLRSSHRQLPLREALEITRAIASALSALHEQGLVHSDVKPGNILLERNGGIKLIDFSTARPRAVGAHQATADLKSYSGYSPAYASPELLADEPAHPADDVYSLACVAYEMLTGHHPFGRLSAAEAAHRGLRPQRRSPLTTQQWRTLRRGLDFDRDQRFQDIGSFAKRLCELPRSRHHLPATALVLALLAGGAATILTPLLQKHAREHQALLALAAQLEQLELVTAEIRAAPPPERVRALARVEQLNEPFRSAALGLVAEDVAATLHSRIEQELRMGQGAHFPERLTQELSELRLRYPAARHIEKAEALIKREEQP